MAGRYEISSARWAMIESIVPLLNAWDAQGAMTVRCLTVSSGNCARAPNGGIFQSALGLMEKKILDYTKDITANIAPALMCTKGKFQIACIQERVRITRNA